MSDGAASLGYDARGNLTSIGAVSYTYNSLDQLVTGPGTTLSHDPAGRLGQLAGGAGLICPLLYPDMALSTTPRPGPQ